MKNLIMIILILIYSNEIIAQNSIFDLLSIKKPKKENKNYQIKVLNKWKVESNYLFSLDSIYIDSMGQSINHTLDTHMYKWGYYSPIQFRVYKNNGNFHAGWAYCFGSLNKLKILLSDSITRLTRLPLNDKLNLFNDIKMLEKKEELNLNFKDYDYIILAFWASYYGSSAKKMLQELDRYSKRKKILIIKVNYNGFE